MVCIHTAKLDHALFRCNCANRGHAAQEYTGNIKYCKDIFYLHIQDLKKKKSPSFMGFIYMEFREKEFIIHNI